MPKASATPALPGQQSRPTINTIQAEMRAAGSHWWDADTMSFFGTIPDKRVYSGPGGVFFCTEDDTFERLRGWTVRKYADGDIHTVGQLCDYMSRTSARRKCEELAGADTYTEAKHQPITPVDDLQAAIRQHAKVDVPADIVRLLMTLTRRHHRACEKECNEGGDWTTSVETQIEKWLVKHVRGVGVKFSGDPRGATVKLIFPDKATNDMGGTGWCVPTLGGDE